ncbi:MAG: DUF4390 domain-containing protein [Acidobacteriota bacterium]
MRPFAPWIVAVVCVSLLAVVAGASGRSRPEARIEALEVAVENRRLMVSFHLVDAFGDDLRRRVDSGLPTELSYELELNRDRKRWFDKDLETSRLQAIAMFNAVTSEYLINFKQDGRLIESRMVRDRDDLIEAMTHFDGLPAFDLDGRDAESRYLLRVRARLGVRNAFGWIPRSLATDWIESRKFRVGDG